MKEKNKETEHNIGNGTPVPILSPGIGTRIKTVSSVFRTRADAASAAGVSPDMLYRYIREESPPSFSAMTGLATSSGVNMEWIATGKGPMRGGEDELGAEFTTVAQYAVEASAGGGSLVELEPEIGRLAFSKAWLEKKGLSKAALAVIRIKGDSMMPTIRDAALVLVDTSHDQFFDDGIYVLQYDGYLIAKRLQRDAISAGVLIKSDNPAYETQRITGDQVDDLRIIGRVVWVGQEV